MRLVNGMQHVSVCEVQYMYASIKLVLRSDVGYLTFIFRGTIQSFTQKEWLNCLLACNITDFFC
jgi:hypothetical protein